jgi:hypothetical protein
MQRNKLAKKPQNHSTLLKVPQTAAVVPETAVRTAVI